MTTEGEQWWSCVLEFAVKMQYSENNDDRRHVMMFACLVHCLHNTMAWGPPLSKACQEEVCRGFLLQVEAVTRGRI